MKALSAQLPAVVSTHSSAVSAQITSYIRPTATDSVAGGAVPEVAGLSADATKTTLWPHRAAANHTGHHATVKEFHAAIAALSVPLFQRCDQM